MPRITHVHRRGARYHFRRRWPSALGEVRPITIPLKTSDPDFARKRAARVAVRWDEVIGMFEPDDLSARGVLRPAEMAAVMNGALEHEVSCAVAGYLDPNVDVETAKRSHTTLSKAYQLAARLPAGTETLPMTEITALQKEGATEQDIRHICLAMRAFAAPGAVERAAMKLLGAADAPVNPSTVRDAAKLVLKGRAEAQDRAFHYSSPAVQAAFLPASVLMENTSAELKGMTAPAPAPEPATPTAQPAADPADNSPFFVKDTRRFSEALDEVIGRVRAAGDWRPDTSQQRRIALTFAWITGDKPLCDYTHLDTQAFVDGLHRLPSNFRPGTPQKGPMSRSFGDVLDEIGPVPAHKRRAVETVNRDLSTMSRITKELTKTSWRPRVGREPVLGFTEHLLKKSAPSVINPDRLPWTPDHLRVLFKLPLFNGKGGAASRRLRVSTSGVVWHDAAYWVPLLGAYTFAAREELCGLEIDDVITEGVPHLEIRNNMTRSLDGVTPAGEKAVSRRRQIPLHPELVRLGFLDYWKELKKQGHKALFPELYLKDTATRGGKKFYKAWQPITRAVDAVLPLPRTDDGKAADFHSLRTYGQSVFEASNAKQSEIDDFFGHARTGTGPRNYGRSLHVIGLESVLARRLALLVDIAPNVTSHLERHPVRLLPLVRRSLVGNAIVRKTRVDKGKPRAGPAKPGPASR